MSEIQKQNALCPGLPTSNRCLPVPCVQKASFPSLTHAVTRKNQMQKRVSRLHSTHRTVVWLPTGGLGSDGSGEQGLLLPQSSDSSSLL